MEGGGPQRKAPQHAAHNKSCKSPCVFARRGLGDGERDSTRLNRVFVEQNGQVVTVSVGVELVDDVRSVITGFLEDHHVEATASDTEDLRGPWSTERRYSLCMRSLTESVSGMSNVGLGTKPQHGEHNKQRLGEEVEPPGSCGVGVPVVWKVVQP